jgi:predicted nucleic acid-binding protein
MILIDTSVWIDYFRGAVNPQTEHLDKLLGHQPLAIGDLILTEVLQGFRSDTHYARAKRMLMSLRIFDLAGERRAIKAAANCRFLRANGITVRKTIDTFIATFCIETGMALLHNDRDFEPYERYLGLQSAL